jgi:hypothetical protein
MRFMPMEDVVVRRTSIMAAGLALLVVAVSGCVSRGLYQKTESGLVEARDWQISEAERSAIREEITKDIAATGFSHGIPPFWHLRVRPTEAYRNEFVYVIPVLSYHSSDLTIGNVVCWRSTSAPISYGLVRNWPWSGDTNLIILWQNRHSYYAVFDAHEIVVYRDYLGSFIWLPVTRLFCSPREVARIRRTSPEQTPVPERAPGR